MVDFSRIWWTLAEYGRMRQTAVDCRLAVGLFLLCRWKQVDVCKVSRRCPVTQYINNVLFNYLNNFCTAYLDNIIIYSKNKLEYKEHVYKILSIYYSIIL